MNKPGASVILPVYNRHECVRVAIDSVLNQQTKILFELIVVNDGSTDGTSEVLGAYGDRLTVIEKQNGGAASARNVGVNAAKADIIVFLDSDDTSEPGRIELQAGYMIAHPDVEVTFGAVQIEGREVMRVNDGLGFSALDNPLGLLLGAVRGPMLWNAASAVRKNVYIEAGMQNEELPCGEDFDFWCRALSSSTVAYTSTVLTRVGRGSGARLSNSSDAYREKAYALQRYINEYAGDLSAEERKLANSNLRESALALVRHEWAFGDRQCVNKYLSEYRDVLTACDIRLWTIFCSLVPGVVGRIARRWIVKSRGY